jgi:outer membrane protein TolC
MSVTLRRVVRAGGPLAALLLGASMLSACASVPNLGAAPAMRPVDTYASAHGLDAPVADWPAERWWSDYGDAQLTALIEEGLSASPSMAAASARVRRAEALQAQAGAALQLQVGAQGQLNAAVADLGELAPSGGGPQA